MMMKGFAGKTEKIYFVFSLISLISIFSFVNVAMPVRPNGDWKEVAIPAGASYRQGLRILKENGIIKNELVFLLFGKFTNIETKMRAGYYNMSTSMSPWDIFDRLRKGEIIEETVRIPEGADLNIIKGLLSETGLINDESWQLAYDMEFMGSLGIDAPSLEGYLYPDTYKFSKGAGTEIVLRIMVDRLKQKFNPLLRERAAELGMSENEVLTLASIIERETFLDNERALISAVYHNRLKKKMKLQADPTVHYGTERAGYRIRSNDLGEATPYNTYVIKGLPPGPIASPGIKSIKATLFPADTDYLFFVSRNDGTHQFSRTGKEHLEAVTLFQKNGAK